MSLPTYILPQAARGANHQPPAAPLPAGSPFTCSNCEEPLSFADWLKTRNQCGAALCAKCARPIPCDCGHAAPFGLIHICPWSTETSCPECHERDVREFLQGGSFLHLAPVADGLQEGGR